MKAQDGLIKRCDDICLKSHSIAINKNIGFIEWTMILKIKGIEFSYEGRTRLILDEQWKKKNIEIILTLFFQFWQCAHNRSIFTLAILKIS